MALLFFLAIFLSLYVPIVLAQSNASDFTSLTFELFSCGNGLREFYPDPNPAHMNTSFSHNLIKLSGTDRNGTQFPNQYAVPISGVPFRYYEGFITSAFFFPASGFPRGWAYLDIPESSKGKKTNIQAGKLFFEGVEFNCARLYGGLAEGGGALNCQGNYCSKYTYCSHMYKCTRELWPEDRKCELPSERNFCWPGWE
jgi:hypothetical protein